jgi:hypothetical protein
MSSRPPSGHTVGPRLEKKNPIWQLCTEMNNKITCFNKSVWAREIRFLSSKTMESEDLERQ